MKYEISNEIDSEILSKCILLEKLGLLLKDRDLVILIKSQLEADWRKHLLDKLNQLLKKYKIN